MKTLWVLEGPTAVGKTDLAIAWAKRLNTEIVSADSRQLYREMTIGVARPTEQELSEVPHHFIANKSIHEYYSISNYEQEALTLLSSLFGRYDNVVLSGGSGLYVKALCEGLDELPDADPKIRKQILELYEEKGIDALKSALEIADPTFYKQADLSNPARLRRALEVCYISGKPFSEIRKGQIKERPFNIRRYAITRERSELYERINQRVLNMIEEGLEEEAFNLYKYRDLSALQTVGYRELFNYFDGKISLAQAIEDISMNTRRYAKRQLTWLNHQTPCTFIDISGFKKPNSADFFPMNNQ